MTRSTHCLRRLLAPALSLLAACTVGPDYVPPEPVLPDAWHQQAVDGLAGGESRLRRWWEHFEDPVLDGLIGRATEGNLDLGQAFQRILAARAQRGIATGERYPDLEMQGAVQRGRASEGVDAVIPPPQSRTDNRYGTGFGARWEIDLWGRITRSIESADADLQASYEDYRDVLVLLYAEVAASYIDVRAQQARIVAAEANVAAQKETLALTSERYDAEISPQLDVRQAELNLAITEASIPPMKASLAAAIHALGVLIGEPPETLWAELSAPAPIPLPPESVAVGVPADVLRQRPDVRAAERTLAALTAQIGVATAAAYPEFTLGGSFEYVTTSSASGGVFDSGNRAWTLGPSFRWNLFDGGRVENNILFQDALAAEALAAYRQTVLLALQEVEDAMVAYVQERDRRDALQRAATAAQSSVELADELYRAGLTDFQNVQAMQRTLAEQQDALALSESRVAAFLVDVFRALGGGWQPPPAQLADEIEDAAQHGEPIL